MRLSNEYNDMGYRGMSDCKHIKPRNTVTTCANCYQELEAENANLQNKLAYHEAHTVQKRLRKVEAENAALKKDIQTMVEKAAAKHRPAYDEQQKIIMELQAQVDALSPALDHVDLMVDEFLRIKALCYQKNDEIRGLCERAIQNTYQHVPAQKRLNDGEARLAQLPRIARDLKRLSVMAADTYGSGEVSIALSNHAKALLPPLPTTPEGQK